MAGAKSVRADSKIAVLCTRLRGMALELGPDARLPKFDELCTLLATSRVTLSEVLEELEEQQVIYRQHSKGIFVSPHILRKNIAVIFNSSYFINNGPSPFWGMLWGLLAQEARQRETEQQLYHFFAAAFPQTDEYATVPEDIKQRVLTGRIHGAITIGLSVLETEWLIAQGVPCVTFAGGGPWGVSIDTIELVRMGMKSLTHQQCRRLEFWLPHFEADEGLEHFLERVIADRGLVFDAVRVRRQPDSTLPLQKWGYQTTIDLFRESSNEPPDGIVILNDLITDGMLSACLAQGIHVGTDVKVATHANSGSMLILDSIPGLTAIEVDPIHIVHALFAQLDLLIDGQIPDTPLVAIKPRIRQTNN